MNKIKTCPVCNSIDLQTIQNRKEFLQNSKLSKTVIYEDIICGSCGLLFSEPNLNEKSFKKYYKNYFSSLSNTSETEILSRLSVIKLHLKEQSTILEVGGGKGLFNKKLNEIYLRADNDDLSEDEVKLENQYDCICSYYLMEHLFNINEWMMFYLKKLKTGGYFILEVPNFEKFPVESMNNEHLFHFKPNDMVNLLNKYGIKVISIDEKNPSRYFGFSIVGIKQNYFDFKINKQIEKTHDSIVLINKSKKRLKEVLLKINEIIKNTKGYTGVIPCNINTSKIVTSSYDYKNKLILFDNDIEKHNLDWCNSSLVVNKVDRDKIKKCSSFIITSKRYNKEIRNQLNLINKNLIFHTFDELN